MNLSVYKLASLKRRSTLIALMCATFILVGGSIAAGEATTPHDSSKSANAATTSTSQWTIPSDEQNAPLVATPGGASYGDGGFNAVDCPTSQFCAAVGASGSLEGVVVTSNDDGASWSASPLESGVPELNAIDCASASDCVAVGEGVALTTSDGGVSWSTQSIPTPNTTLLGVSCPNTSLCISDGVTPGNSGPYGGQLLYSSNAGLTWATASSSTPIGALGSVDCPSTTFCVAVGAQILVSTDGGESWSPRTVDGGTGVLRAVSCSSALDCVAIGPDPMGYSNTTLAAFEISTSDGGATWQSNVMPAGLWMMNSISCTGDATCVVAGPSSSTTSAPMFLSADNGSTWTTDPPPTGVTSIGSLNCESDASCVFTGYEGDSAVFGEAPSSGSGSVTSAASLAANSPAAS